MSVLVLAAPVVAQAAQEEASESEAEATSLSEAVTGGTISLGFRYRYEFVEVDAGDPDAHASTLRTVLGLRTRPWKGFDFFIEAENVADLGGDWYRDSGQPPRGNGVVDRPVVADPAGTDINQVALGYSVRDTRILLGRQEINIADQRFVGAVGWRQHHQTFSAVRVLNSRVADLDVQYTFSNNVYRIFGDKLGTKNHFISGAWEHERLGTVRGYAFLLDYDDPAFALLSTNSFGAELAGAWAAKESVSLDYEFEYARQVDAGDNPAPVSAAYVHLMGGAGYRDRLVARVGWELLGGSPENGQFNTPLATLHKFNGWADKFVQTPTEGLSDTYVRFNGRLLDFDWLIAYHRFAADSADRKYGDEVDWELAWTAPWRQTIAFLGAWYGADTFSDDTLKIWLLTTYAF